MLVNGETVFVSGAVHAITGDMMQQNTLLTTIMAAKRDAQLVKQLETSNSANCPPIKL